MFNFNITAKPDYDSLNKTKKKSKNKLQASKNRAHQAVELEWLQQFVNTRVFIGLLVLIALLSIPYIFPNEDILPIGKIRVSGEYKQLDIKKVNQNLQAYLDKGFFSVDIKTIQQQISQQPWIRTVSVKRIWPDQLHVDIKERQAIARWDDNHLLSKQAVIFEADSEKFVQLPRINGYSGQSLELLRRYKQMQLEFSRHGILITEMTEDNKGALSLVLNKNLKVSIGSENNETKIQHLLAAYPKQIKPRVEKIKHIDFRYSNGFAIAWKDEYRSDDLKQRGNKNV